MCSNTGLPQSGIGEHTLSTSSHLLCCGGDFACAEYSDDPVEMLPGGVSALGIGPGTGASIQPNADIVRCEELAQDMKPLA